MKKEIKEICPNCIGGEWDKNISNTKDGKCGVCGGDGFIIYKPIGKIVGVDKE